MIQTADLTRNVKQSSFFNTVLAAAVAKNPYRYLFYGGAIRGGKTFACIICLIILCKIFPGSKWYVIRKSFTNLQETTIPTMTKILANSPVRWSRDKSNYFVEFRNGSRIFFAGENFNADPKLNWMLGLETNGFFLEQAEELQELTLDMCISRAGSWIIPRMPTPLILGSFNPTLTWIRQKIYVPYIEGNLLAPFFYQEAGPKDNPFVTEEQWKGWEHMDQQLQDQFIGGSWDFAKPGNVFAYAFDERKHHADVHIDSEWPLHVSFDFNVEPITCLFEQHDALEWVHVCKEIRLISSDIWALTEHIIAEHADAFFMVTGDATGRARSAISKNNRSYYQIIQQELQLSTNQIKVPRANPSIRNTRVLTNSLFSKHPRYLINTKACPHLTLDLNGVVVNEKGEIDKDADKRKTHLLDCLRYNNWTWHRDFLDKNLYQYLSND